MPFETWLPVNQAAINTAVKTAIHLSSGTLFKGFFSIPILITHKKKIRTNNNGEMVIFWGRTAVKVLKGIKAIKIYRR